VSTSDSALPAMSLRTPEDLLAMIPYLIGYPPIDSLVILGLVEKALGFTARVDLPADTNEIADFRSAVEHLADVTATNATACIIVAYGEPHIATPVIGLACDLVTNAGLVIVNALRVTDNRYSSHLCPDPDCCPPDGKPIPATNTLIDAEAVLGGMTVRASRADLIATVAPITGQRRADMQDAALRATAVLLKDLELADPDHDTAAAQAFTRRRGSAVVNHALDHHRGRLVLTDEQAATLLVLLRNPDVRDHALLHTNADDLDLWADLTRRAPRTLTAPVATVLAYTAWLAGNGALANMALDRATHANPDYPLAHLLRRALQAGAPPALVASWMTEAITDTGTDEHDR
jgi:hypothetical protein